MTGSQPLRSRIESVLSFNIAISFVMFLVIGVWDLGPKEQRTKLIHVYISIFTNMTS